MSGEGLRFCPDHRLRRPQEFSAVFASRGRLRGEWFELRFLQRQEGPAPVSARLGLVVPKRLARRAVLRNLLKRLARESFRGSRTRLPAMDLVLRLSRAVAPGQEEGLRRVWRQEIDGLLARLPK